MRPVQQMTNAGVTGPGVWVPIDYMQKAFAIGFRCTLGGTASPSATYKVQHAFESGVPDTVFTLTRSSTTATLTFNAITALNNIDNGNIGAAGIYPSQLKPTTLAQSLFGGTAGLTWQMPGSLAIPSGSTYAYGLVFTTAVAVPAA